MYITENTEYERGHKAGRTGEVMDDTPDVILYDGSTTNYYQDGFMDGRRLIYEKGDRLLLTRGTNSRPVYHVIVKEDKGETWLLVRGPFGDEEVLRTSLRKS